MIKSEMVNTFSTSSDMSLEISAVFLCSVVVNVTADMDVTATPVKSSVCYRD